VLLRARPHASTCLYNIAHSRRDASNKMDNDAFRKIMATPRPHDGKPAEKFDKKSIVWSTLLV